MPRVLATQSHVVHGYVGNKAATFPLQCLGWDVDCCNSVQFSNHTGYGMDKVFGNITEESDLDRLLHGVLSNFPTNYDAFLTGYLPNKGSVKCMGKYYRQFKELNPEAIWLMDPVMGDEGELYVSEDVIPEYKGLALDPNGIVDIITPNQFELEILYDNEITSIQQMKAALQQLHKTIPVIIVTSCNSKIFDDPNNIYCIASLRGQEHVVFRVPLIDSYFTGVGDLFSALLLDRLYKFKTSSSQNELKSSFENQINDVLNVIQNVLLLTKEYAPKNIKSVIGDPKKMKDMELRIIESRDLFDTSKEQNRNDSKVSSFLYKTI